MNNTNTLKAPQYHIGDVIVYGGKKHMVIDNAKDATETVSYKLRDESGNETTADSELLKSSIRIMTTHTSKNAVPSKT